MSTYSYRQRKRTEAEELIEDLRMRIAMLESAVNDNLELSSVVRSFLSMRHARYPGVHADIAAAIETLEAMTGWSPYLTLKPRPMTPAERQALDAMPMPGGY